MCEWYESLSDEQIEWLKGNRVQYRLLTAKETTLLNDVPLKECEWHNTSKWIPVTQKTRFSDIVYRLRPDWERPPSEPEWTFRDVPLKTDDDTSDAPRTTGRILGSFPYLNSIQRAPHYYGYVGTIYEWRGYRFIADIIGMLTALRGAPCYSGWHEWTTDPSVEPPRPVAVRVREKK